MTYGIIGYFGHNASVAAWKTLPVGAGGFNQGASIGWDGVTQTLMVRTDTYGGLVWDPAATSPIGTTGSWKQLVTALSMPTDYVNGAVGQASQGVYEIQMCYSTPSVVYMLTADVNAANTNNSTVFKSTNSGATWVRTGFTPIAGSAAPANDQSWKTHGPKICINPSDSTKLYVGTQGAGLWLSTNGGTSFSLVSTSSIPNPTAGGGYTGMCWSRSNTSNIFISPTGGGVYFSGNGGSAWAKLTTGTGPTTVFWADIDEGNGNYWCVDNNGGLWKWNGTTWGGSAIITGASNQSSVAVDPGTTNHIIFCDHNTLFESTNGTSFGSASSTPSFGGDIPWIPNSQLFGYTNNSPLFFDRTTARTLYGFGNLGPFIVTWSGAVAGSNPAFTIRGRGVEQMVGLEVVVPPGGSPVCTAWDNGIFYKSAPLNTSYPTINTNNVFPAACWSCDYAFGTPTFLVAIGDGDYEGGTAQAATSSNGGSSWTLGLNMPIATANGACVAVSTASNFIIGDGNTRQPYYTLNGGSNWTAITLPGTPSWSGFGGFQGRGKWMSADRVNANNFALMFAGQGFYTSANGGATFTGPFNATIGAGLNGDCIMKAVPGNAGHAFICNPNPNVTGGGALFGNYFGYTANMYAGASQAFTQITNVGYAQSFGFGAASPGFTYPTVFYTGYSSFACTDTVTIGTGSFTFHLTGSPGHVILPGSAVTMSTSGHNDMRGSVTSVVGNAVTVLIDTVIDGSGSVSGWFAQIYGTWRSAASNSVPGATPVWTQIGGFPNNSLDICLSVSGDPNTYGVCYVSFGGSSFVYYG